MGTRISRSVIKFLAVILVAYGIGTTVSNGQIGGFIKKRVKGVVSPTKTDAPAEQTPSGPVFSDNVLELNAQNIEKLEKALQCEKDFRSGVEAKYSKLPSREEHQKCMMQVMMSPEAANILKGDPGNIEAAQKMNNQLAALRDKKCGKDPEETIRGKNDELRKSKEEGARCAGLTMVQYSIAMERIAPFCNSGGKDRVPGSGRDYVYSQAEVSTIQPKCSTLMTLISELNGPTGK